MSMAKHEDHLALIVHETDIKTTLKNSLYPGASDENVDMVLSYCRAAKLDPLLKPVHLVGMNVKLPFKDKYGKNQYEWRDVVMPGIGLYRILAARGGNYAGIDEPEFGPVITQKFTTKTISFPEWAKISVYKIVEGKICKFTRKEFWLENYATVGKDNSDPNTMWAKRPYGQIAKCAEAQVLRTAFPEIGSHPTAEEMEGKTIDGDYEELPISTKKDDIKKIIDVESKVVNKESFTFEQLESQMKKANNLTELKEVAEKVKNFAGNPDDIDTLRDFYGIRKTELTEYEQQQNAT